MDYSLPGSFVHGILQARILEWVAMPSLQGIFLTQGSNPGLLHLQADSGKTPYKPSVQFSSVAQSVRLFATPWTAARQASLSITNSQSLLKLTLDFKMWKTEQPTWQGFHEIEHVFRAQTRMTTPSSFPV